MEFFMKVLNWMFALVCLGVVACSSGDYEYQNVSGEIEEIQNDDTDNIDFEKKEYKEETAVKADKKVETAKASAKPADALETKAVVAEEKKEAKVEVLVAPKSEAKVETEDKVETVKSVDVGHASRAGLPSFEDAVKSAERRHPEIILARDNEYFAKNRKAWQGAKLKIKEIEVAGFAPITEAEDVPEAEPTVTFLATIIYHDNGQFNISDEDRKALREVVRFWKEKGGNVKVIGHASARTRDMNEINHKTANLRVSTERALKVSEELARLGVANKKISVGAVADNELMGPENMPSNEAQNRRTEIYIAY
jgi:flagellar motor protein MotB